MGKRQKPFWATINFSINPYSLLCMLRPLILACLPGSLELFKGPVDLYQQVSLGLSMWCSFESQGSHTSLPGRVFLLNFSLTVPKIQIVKMALLTFSKVERPPHRPHHPVAGMMLFSINLFIGNQQEKVKDGLLKSSSCFFITLFTPQIVFPLLLNHIDLGTYLTLP